MINNSISFTSVLFTTIVALTVTRSDSVLAQESEDEDIEIIQVTALKRATTVEDTGMSVSAVGETELKEMGASNFQDFMRTVPGLNFSEGNAPGEQTIIIRGINFPSNRFQLPTVAVYLDETNLSQNGRNPDIDLIDVNRIEVLRGPQGTLYGGSSMGGTIRYITNKPDVDYAEGWVEGGLEHVNEGELGYKTSFMFNTPVSDNVAFRVVGYYRDLSGWIDNIGYIHTGNYEMLDASLGKDDINNDKAYGGRFAIRWQPNDMVTADLSYVKHYAESDGLANWNPNLIDSGNNGAGYGKYKAAVRNEENFSDDNDILSFAVSYKTSWGDLMWISNKTDRSFERNSDLSRERHGLDWWVGDFNSNFSYAKDTHVDGNGNPTSSLSIQPIEYSSISHEIRWVGSHLDERLNWVVGGITSTRDNTWTQYEIYDGVKTAYSSFIPFGFSLDYQAAADENPNEFGVIGSDTWFYTLREEEIKENAVYGNLSYRLTDKWEVSAGLRWYDVDIDNDYQQSGYFGGTAVSLASTDFENGLITQQEFHQIISDNVANNYRSTAQFGQAEDGTQFMVNSSYDFGDVLTYVTVAEGYRIGGINRSFPIRDGSFPVPQSFDSDSLISIELGIKAQLFDRKLMLDASLYDIDWKDIQFALTDPVTSFAFNTNAGEAEVTGLETSATLQVTEDLEINANVTLLEHEVTALSDDASNRGINIGDPLLGVSDERYAIGVRYIFEIGEMEGFVRADYNYTGKALGRYSEDDFPQIDKDTAIVDGYGITTLSAGVEGELWQLNFYIRNLFDDDAIVAQERARFSFNDFEGSDYLGVTDDPGRVTTIRPRTIGVTFRYNFEF